MHKHIRITYNSKQSSRAAIKTTTLSTSIVLAIFTIVTKVEILKLEDTKELETTFHALKTIFYTSKVIYFNIIDFSKEDYTFRDYRFVIVVIIFFLVGEGYELYFDTKYIISLINQKFFLEILLEIFIKKIIISITI